MLAVLVMLCAQLLANIPMGHASTQDFLRVALQSVPATMDAQRETDEYAQLAIQACMRGLYQRDANGMPVQALAATTEISDDGCTYTFRIRDDAFWSNGAPITADDFVFGWQRAFDPAFKNTQAAMLADVGRIQNAAGIVHGALSPETLGVRANGERELVVTLDAPVAFFPALLCYPALFPANRAWVTAMGTQYATSPDTMLTCGSYAITAFIPNRSISMQYTPEADDAPPVLFRQLEMEAYPQQEAAWRALQQGEVDICTGFSGATEPEGSVAFLSGMDTLGYLAVNQQNVPMLRKISIRKTLSDVIDRQELCRLLGSDYVPAIFVIPEGLAVGADGTDFRSMPVALDAAHNEPASENLSETLEMLRKQEVHLDLLVPDDSFSRKVGMYLRTHWEAALPGIKISVTVKPAHEVQQSLASGDFQLCLTHYQAQYPDPQAFLRMWMDNDPNQYGKWNIQAYQELMESITDGSLMLDPVARWGAMHEAENILMDYMVLIPLYQQGQVAVSAVETIAIPYHASPYQIDYAKAIRLP